MRVVVHILCIVFCLLLPVACNPQPEAPLLLQQAGGLIECCPDSAILLIDSISYPEKSLRKKEYMQYHIIRVQARYKNFCPIAEDTLIFAARDYFTKQNKNPKQIALAYFYSGCVYRERRDTEWAMQHYKSAEHYADKTTDVDLKGLVQYNIGNLFSEQGLHRQALQQYQIAEEFFRQSPIHPQEKQTKCLSAIGRVHMLLEEQDHSFAAFHKGLDLAKSASNTQLQSLLAQNLSVAYREVGKYKSAKDYLMQSFLLNTDSTELSRYYLNFAELYSLTNQSDSLTFYRNKLIRHLNSIDDPYLKASGYSFLGEEAMTNKDFVSAFNYQQKRTLLIEKITQKQLEQSVYEVQQKYDFELLQNKHAQDLINRHRWIIGLLLFSIVGGALFVAYIQTKRKQNSVIKENLNTIREMNRDLEAMVEQKNVDLRKELLWRFDVAKKVMALNELTNKKNSFKMSDVLLGQFNHIVYGASNIEEQWDAMFNAFNNARPDYADKIKKSFPEFTENEFRICILTYVGFRIKEIALILNQTPNTIQTRRSEMRRKIGIAQRDNFADFLDEKMK